MEYFKIAILQCKLKYVYKCILDYNVHVPNHHEDDGFHFSFDIWRNVSFKKVTEELMHEMSKKHVSKVILDVINIASDDAFESNVVR